MSCSKVKKIFANIFFLSVALILVPAIESKAYVEEKPTVYVVREANGELEKLEAIEISDEIAEGWSIAESYHNTLNEVSAEATRFLELGSDYGYQDMLKRSHSAGRQYAYQQLEKICKAFSSSSQDAEEISLSGNTYCVAGEAELDEYTLTSNEIIEVYFTFRNDNPQYFWLSNQVVFSANSISVLSYDAYKMGNTRLSTLEEIVQTSQEVYQSKIASEDSKYQKVLKIHDALIRDIEYCSFTNVPVAHSIAGAMTSSKTAVCEGYAKTMQVMLNQYGIKNVYVTGEAGGGHAWNAVCMNDRKYYWLDATWDDQKDIIFQHVYFLVGNNNFTDHQADQPTGAGIDFLYELPKVSDLDYVDTPSSVVVVKGDINEDETVNLKDLMLCLNHVSKKSLLEGTAYEAADIDEDGTVSLKDLMRILNFVSKKSGVL